MKRVLAVVVAVGMVSLAVVIRSAIDDDDGGGDGDPPTGGDVVVVCATDLAEACRTMEGVEVRVEDPATTAAALADGRVADDVDSWITSTAWMEVADSRAPDALEERRALATSAAVVATAPGRFEAITDLCGTEDVWFCLGDAAGRSWADLGAGSPSWGELEVGMPDPDTAVGLGVLASSATGFFSGNTFASNDLRSGEFGTWLGNLVEGSSRTDANPARTMATAAGTYSAAGSVLAQAEGLEGRGIEVVPPIVSTAVTVAAVRLRGGDALPDTDLVRNALEADGWAGADEDHLAPTLKPGVMAALYTVWTEVTR